MTTPVHPSRPQPRGALHYYLDDLAGQAHGADLRDRVLASSRRVRVRRRVVTSLAAAVAVAAVVSGVAFAGQPRGKTDEKLPVAVTPPALPPTLYYQMAGDTTALYSWDSKVKKLFEPTGYVCGLYLSPDGRKVAWVAVDGAGGTGKLIVAGRDGAAPRTLLGDVACTAENTPVWLPDSVHLLIRQANDAPRQTVSIRTDVVADSPLATTRGDLAWSPNGQYVAYQDAGKIVVARPDGTVVREVAHGDETPTGGFTVQGVTDDGRRVVVGMRPSDPGQVRTGFRLVDTVTGRNVPVPHAGAVDSAIYPAPGNMLLVRQEAAGQRRVYLIGDDLEVIDSRSEPASLHDALLLSTPAAG